MSINGGLHVCSEIRVRNRRGAEVPFVRLRDRDAFAEFTTGALRCFDDGNRAVVLLHDDLEPLLADSRQDRVDVAGEHGFGKAECHPVLDHTESSWPLSCSRL